MNTRITYMYRDGGNWKKSAAVVVSGAATPAQVLAISTSLDTDGFFVPAAVGMDMLAPYGEEWCDDDHPYHTIESVAVVPEQPTIDLTITELVDKFQNANWAKAAENFDRCYA